MDQEQIDIVNKLIERKGYKAISKISEGSYGEVYMVIKIQDNQVYAVKILDRKKIRKYQKEHEGLIEGFILKKLNFVGVIKIYETILEEDWIFYIMEYCKFGNVFNLIRNVSYLSNSAQQLDVKKYYLAQILQTLDFLHSNNIIHRDLKPQNIVLGSDLRIKFIDFGSAKCLDSNFYQQNQIKLINETRQNNSKQKRKSFVGSASYLSPEGTQCQHSSASDIWAFGVIVYKFYHGYLPFSGENNYLIFKKIKEEQPQIKKGTCQKVKELILGCMKKNPKQRPTAKFLKAYSFFKGVNFSKIFKEPVPITPSDIKVKEEKTQCKLSIQLEKRMFFGNFKPRILSMVAKNNQLLMSYAYVDTKVIKNQFQLNMNDYALVKTNEQFQVINDDKRYWFRVKKCPSQDIVQEINMVIRNHFKLQ